MSKYQFSDMYSGGSCKVVVDGEEVDEITIEADDFDDAVEKFELKYGINPTLTQCKCCGRDYSISEEEEED
jgi:hypothetical protein